MAKKLLFLTVLLLVSTYTFAQVDTAWVRRYNGPGNGWDWANALAVDASGNVCVTGESWGSGTGFDYATIKYYPNGDTAWVRRYNGPYDSLDQSNAIALDISGNVYVTGFSTKGVEYDFDWATIKYYPNGDTAWLRMYDGPGGSADYAFDIAIDNSGNVYVTGSVTPYHKFGVTTQNLELGILNNYDTQEPSFHREKARMRRHNRLGLGKDILRYITVDYTSNFYINGESSSDIAIDEKNSERRSLVDYCTIKYYPNGDTAWVRQYDCAGDWDRARAIAVDSSGSVYVTGDSYGSSVTGWDYATIKYFPNGDVAWVRRYNGTGDSTEQSSDVAIDNSGNVYVTGMSYGSGTDYDYATIKYDSSGTELWVKRYNGPGDSTDCAWAIALDESSNVYVTGRSWGSGTGWDYATIKYYPNGDTAWVRRYNGPENDWDGATEALAVDDFGNVYVSGWSWGGGTEYDYATVKYDPDGNTAWVRRYNGPANGYDEPFSIGIDGSGDVYVTGYSYGDGTDKDLATIKYVQYSCGDVNNDEQINLSDPICLANYYFGKPCQIIPWASDVNCEAGANLGDAIIIANVYFGKPGFELNCCE